MDQRNLYTIQLKDEIKRNFSIGQINETYLNAINFNNKLRFTETEDREKEQQYINDLVIDVYTLPDPKPKIAEEYVC